MPSTVSAWSPRKMVLRPVCGWVRTIGCATGGTFAFCFAVSGSSPWRRVRAKSKFLVAGGPAIFGLHGGRQQVIGGIHVSELGFSTHVRHNLRVHHGCLSGAFFPGAIGVPVQRASIRMFAARIAVLVEIGKHVDFRVFLVAVILA